VNIPGWIFFICISICLAISACYEILEAFVAIISGGSAGAFLGTQGYVFDTQSDMLYALVGAGTALLLLPKIHNRSMGQIKG
jgi:putative membrane protein